MVYRNPNKLEPEQLVVVGVSVGLTWLCLQAYLLIHDKRHPGVPPWDGWRGAIATAFGIGFLLLAFGGASIAGDGPETVTVALTAAGGAMLVLSPLLAMVGKR